jgi:Ca2+-binding RTX toxin-like protein
MSTINGSSNNDTLTSISSSDEIYGYGGNDTIFISAYTGNDNANGGTGTDLLVVDWSGNTYSGGTNLHAPGMYFSGSFNSDTDPNTGAVSLHADGYASAQYSPIFRDKLSFTNMEQLKVTGTSSNDTFNVWAGRGWGTSTLDGGSGDDSIRGGHDSTDSILAGVGNDAIDGMIAGGNYSAIISAANDTIDGGAGSDTLASANFSKLTTGYKLTDNGTTMASVTVAGGTRASNLEYISNAVLGSGNDTVAYSGRINESVSTSAGNDTINMGFGNDYADGGAGTDLLVVDWSGNTYAGGTNLSAPGMYFNSSFNSYTDPNTGAVSLHADGYASAQYAPYYRDNLSFSNMEHLKVTGTSSNDTFNVWAGRGWGTSTLDGGGGDDSLRGGHDSTDSILAGIGNDAIDALSAGVNYSDIISAANDSIDGGAGSDTLASANFSKLTTGYKLTDDGTTMASVTVAGGTRASNLEYISNAVLGSGNDTVAYTGRTSENVWTGAGNDTINMGFGNDNADGGAGTDLLVVDWSSNTYAGGANLPTPGMSFSADGVGSGLARAKYLPSKNDYLSFSNMEKASIVGTAYADSISGLNGGNTINGGAGNDNILGGTGSDSIIGGADNDTLQGCLNTIIGGKGEIDTLTGGTGNDLFVLGTVAGRFYDDGVLANSGASDYALITDFTVGNDRLQLKGAASNYLLGSSGSSGVTGSGLYFDSNGSKGLDSNDELIAIIRSGSATSLTTSNVITTALFI